MPKLHVSLPNGTEVVHDLNDETITVGRVSDNAIQIDDASVSSHHAQFTLVGGSYHLRDLNSTNGTRHNGQRISDSALQDGDRIRFGKVEAVFRASVSSESRPMPAVAPVSITPAASSRKPADFANASPFGSGGKVKDSGGRIIMGFAILAMLAFAAALASILTLSPP